MKLLVCRECKDTLALCGHEVRRCRCGAVAGRYREDGHQADAVGPYIAFGIHSGDISRVLTAARLGLPFDLDVRSWVIPESAGTLHRSDVSLFFDRSAECSAEFVEATTGFEPVNRGFADLGSTQPPERLTTAGDR